MDSYVVCARSKPSRKARVMILCLNAGTDCAPFSGPYRCIRVYGSVVGGGGGGGGQRPMRATGEQDQGLLDIMRAILSISESEYLPEAAAMGALT